MSEDPLARAGGSSSTDEEVAALAERPLNARGFLAGASNHTMLVQVGAATDGRFAVYKPRAGERPLWDFPAGTLCDREVAAFLVSEALGWGLVPATVLREDGPRGPGSLQLFVPHDPDRHYFALVDEGGFEAELARMAVFDLLINNADRKGGHVMVADDGGLVGCDHGLSFHVQPKLRTVIWDLGGYELAEGWRRDLRRVADDLSGDGELAVRLAEHLDADELEALAARAGALVDLRALPDLPPRQRPYPWPPL